MDFLKALWAAIRDANFRKALMMIATQDTLFYLLGAMAFILIALIVNVAFFALAIMPWYEVLLGLVLYIILAGLFSWAIHKILKWLFQ